MLETGDSIVARTHEFLSFRLGSPHATWVKTDRVTSSNQETNIDIFPQSQIFKRDASCRCQTDGQTDIQTTGNTYTKHELGNLLRGSVAVIF